MAIDQFARLLAMNAMHHRDDGDAGYTKTEMDTKLSEKANAPDVAANRTALAEMLHYGQKNLLDTSKLPSEIVHASGIVIKNNGDGSLTISGKNESETSAIPITNFNTGLYNSVGGQQNGNWLTGTDTYFATTGLDVDSGIGIQICYSVTGNDATTMKSTRTSTEFDYSEEYPYVWFRLLIPIDTVFSEPITIRPMICKKSLYNISAEFEQYAMSNLELTQALNQLVKAVEALQA